MIIWCTLILTPLSGRGFAPQACQDRPAPLFFVSVQHAVFLAQVAFALWCLLCLIRGEIQILAKLLRKQKQKHVNCPEIHQSAWVNTTICNKIQALELPNHCWRKDLSNCHQHSHLPLLSTMDFYYRLQTHSALKTPHWCQALSSIWNKCRAYERRTAWFCSFAYSCGTVLLFEMLELPVSGPNLKDFPGWSICNFYVLFSLWYVSYNTLPWWHWCALLSSCREI